MAQEHTQAIAMERMMEALASLSEEDRENTLKLLKLNDDDKKALKSRIENEKKSAAIAAQATEVERAASDFKTEMSR